jgi:hypothetical protein
MWAARERRALGFSDAALTCRCDEDIFSALGHYRFYFGSLKMPKSDGSQRKEREATEECQGNGKLMRFESAGGAFSIRDTQDRTDLHRTHGSGICVYIHDDKRSVYKVFVKVTGEQLSEIGPR